MKHLGDWFRATYGWVAITGVTWVDLCLCTTAESTQD